MGCNFKLIYPNLFTYLFIYFYFLQKNLGKGKINLDRLPGDLSKCLSIFRDLVRTMLAVTLYRILKLYGNALCAYKTE